MFSSFFTRSNALEASTGNGLNDAQAEANGLLKLEAHDLTTYIKSQIAALQLPHSMSQLRTQAKQFENRP
jgi:hypothetical protein